MDFLPRWKNIANRLNASALITRQDTSPSSLEEFRQILALSVPITYNEIGMCNYTKEILNTTDATVTFLRASKQTHLALCNCALVSKVFNVPETVYISRDRTLNEYNYRVSLEPPIKSPAPRNTRGGSSNRGNNRGRRDYNNHRDNRNDYRNIDNTSDRAITARAQHLTVANITTPPASPAPTPIFSLENALSQMDSAPRQSWADIVEEEERNKIE